MLIDDIEQKIHKLGYTQTKRDTNTRLIVYLEASERISALKGIADSLDGAYTPRKFGTGWKSSVGAAIIGSYVVLAKPSTGGKNVNIASLDARTFSKLGKKVNFEFNGKNISCTMFNNKQVLQDSILQGLKSNVLLGESYSEALSTFFNTDKISWSPDTPLPIKNKLGVYLGELLIGWALLSPNTSKYFITNPFKGTPKRFLIPDDPSFSGVDSFIEMTNGSYYAISSKYGAGAKASLFTNLFEKGIKNYSKLEPSVFKTMCKHAYQKNIPYNKSREFVYSYGVYEILKIKQSQVPNTNKIYESIRNRKTSNEVDLVSANISRLSDDVKIVNQLPLSISAFFTRSIADSLNNDPKSLKQIQEILSGKDYWQANLNIALWTRGEIKFKFINSGDANLKIYGNKSAIDDITAKQGWINYELKYT